MTTFDTVFILVIIILAFQPFTFSFYYKRHPEALKKFETRRNHKNIFYRISLILLGLSISAVYFIGYIVGASLFDTDVIICFILGSICGVCLAVWPMRLLSDLLTDYSHSSFLISSIVFFVLLAIDLLVPTLMLSEPLLNSSTIHVISFAILTVIALWLNFHTPKASEESTDFTASTKNAPKIDLAALVDSGANSTDEKVSLPKETPAVSSIFVQPPEVSAAPVEKALPEATASQGVSTSLPKHPKHFFAMWVVLASVLFCLLGVAIGYLAGGGYLSPSLVPDSPYIQQLKKAESDASSKGYKKGYHDGRDDGYVAGKEYGYREGYSEGYDEGASDELALLLDDYLG